MCFANRGQLRRIRALRRAWVRPLFLAPGQPASNLQAYVGLDLVGVLDPPVGEALAGRRRAFFADVRPMAQCVGERARFVRGQFDRQPVAGSSPEDELKRVRTRRPDFHAVEDLW